MAFSGTDPSATNAPAAMHRASLAKRASDMTGPATWDAAAAFAGVSDADAFLCHLSRCIACALETLSTSAETARIELRSTREALLCAVNSRCDELDAGIGAAETAKTCALERELCVVDAALECWRAEHHAVAEAAATLSDPELLTQCATLAARLDAAQALLSTLPTATVEPPCVSLGMDVPALIAGILGFCRVTAPLPVTAIDLTLAGGADNANVVSSLQLCLIVQSAKLYLQSDDELGVSLAAAAVNTRVDAALESRGAVLHLLHTSILVDISRRCLIVSFMLPRSTVAGATICVGSVSVFGQPLPSFVGPLRTSVTCTMQPPLILDCCKSDPSTSLISWITHTSSRYNLFRAYGTPLSLCISPSAQIYAPQNGNSDVLVFDLDGAMQDIPVARLGLSQRTMWTAFAGGVFPSLLLADCSRLVAVNPTTRELRWKTASGSFQSCSGLAPLPNYGIVVAASNDDSHLFAHRLSDGVRVGRLGQARAFTYLTADPVTGMIFGSTTSAQGRYTSRVDRFSWTQVAGLRFEETVAATGTHWMGRPLAVMPPAPGKRTSHLVAASGSKLFVLSLPGLVIVHTHRLLGAMMDVRGLAADPFGGALALSDEQSYSIHLLAWPLPGMRPLD